MSELRKLIELLRLLKENHAKMEKLKLKGRGVNSLRK